MAAGFLCCFCCLLLLGDFLSPYIFFLYSLIFVVVVVVVVDVFPLMLSASGESPRPHTSIAFYDDDDTSAMKKSSSNVFERQLMRREQVSRCHKFPFFLICILLIETSSARVQQ